MTNILKNRRFPAVGDSPPGAEGGLFNKRARIEECEHRIKNHLQLISSSLAIQARECADAKARELLMQAHGRVSAVARLHARFQNMAAQERIDVAAFLGEVCTDLSICFNASGACPLALEVSLQSRMMDAADALTLGLIVNELVTNAAKHARPDISLLVRVILREDARSWRLTVSDNGRGLALDAFDTRASLGARLLHALAAHAGGTLCVDPVSKGGSVSLIFD